MYLGYAALMLCRTAVTVASPAMVEDQALGLTAAGFGDLLAYGAAGALMGKLLTGVAADRVGGRRLFLAAVASMAAVTVAFGASSVHTVFMLLIFAAQFAKAGGWPSMAKLIGSWFEPVRHGRIWGIISTSSRVSSMASHLFLGALLLWLPWHWMFYVAGAITVALLGGLYFSLKEGPAQVGLAPTKRQAQTALDLPTQRWEATLPRTALFFAKSPQVWLICGAMMALTVQMEFQNFLPLFFKQSFDVRGGLAGMATSAFPAGSFVSLLVGGVVYDKTPRNRRPHVFGLLLTIGILSVLVLRALPVHAEVSSLDLAIAIAAVFVFGFVISPAYYIPMSVFSIEFGRSRSGVLIGIIDAFGYAAFMVVAPFAGRLVQQIAETGQTWEVFLTRLAGVSLASLALVTVFLVLQHRWGDTCSGPRAGGGQGRNDVAG
jgi:OPA family sugar phosphate sensor protein UhpC-like MFS transporter